MEDLEAAKAKQLSLRERLVARRQQRQNLLAGVLAVSRPSVTAQNKSTADAASCRINKGCAAVDNRNHTSVPNGEPSTGFTSPGQNTPAADNAVHSAGPPDVTTDEGYSAQFISAAPKTRRTPYSSAKRNSPEPDNSAPRHPIKPHSTSSQRVENELEDLLGIQTAKEQENKRIREEILDLINAPTAKERYLSERFRTQGGSQVQQFCTQGTRIECARYKAKIGDRERCTKLHFKKLIQPHTDESLGDCSFLNTCFHVDTCKYVHYTIDYLDALNGARMPRLSDSSRSTDPVGQTSGIKTEHGDGTDPEGPKSFPANEPPVTLYPPQWINCDIRLLNMSILGKFAVIMADPPWDIHMELPYGTMSDDEMRRLDIPCLQDDGYIFLWVTGRAMELGRECLRLWGYQRVDEIIWVKTNQLQRLIRTGRTGHWLNHGKEHCLVGVKGNPKGVNRGLDCDVIVSEVRETSHKPDEIYGIIERLSPGTRKLELFGRPHNLQPNWITLGNQLDGTYLVDPTVVERFKKHYPNGLDMTKT